MKNEKWTVTIQDGEMRVPDISEENTSLIESLTQCWKTMGQRLWEDVFNFDEFKCLLRDTVPVLAEYVNMVVPIQVVSLLLAINEFQNYKEKYEQLKTCESYLKIEIALNDSEAEVYACRNYYNDIVTRYNKLVRSFPSNILAFLLHYKEKTYFDGKDMNDDIKNDFKL